MKKLTIAAWVLLFVWACVHDLNAQQVDANNYVTIDTTNQLVIFHSPIINATFTYQQLQDSSAIANGTATAIANQRVEHFEKMVRVYNDQKSILENWKARQNRIINVQSQMETYITTQLNDMITISDWLEANLGEDPAQPTPSPEPQEGQLRTVDGVLQRYDGMQWVDISDPTLELNQ